MKAKTPFTPEKANHLFLTRLIIFLTLLVVIGFLAGCQMFNSLDDRSVININQEASEQGEVDLSPGQERKDLPPAIVEVDPLPGSVIALDQTITLTFNQTMDAASVEAAVHFEPRATGRFNWLSDQSVSFTPDQPFLPATKLHLAVNISAQAENGKNLQKAIELDYVIAEYLKTTQVNPPDDSFNIDPENNVMVIFNQPVTAVGVEDDTEPAFHLSPAVEGEGIWLNSSTYIFSPAITLDGGTRYTIEINESILAVSGSPISSDQEKSFSFSTAFPAILTIDPSENERLSLDGPIEIQFNIRMDEESVKENFSLVQPSGRVVQGNFSWDDNGKVLTFTPARLLARNTRYTIRIDSGARSIGGMSIGQTQETFRTTYSNFSLDASTTPALETYYGQYGQYQLNFSAPIDRSTYQDKVSIIPDLPMRSLFLADDDRSMILSGFFKPETNYQLDISSDFADVWGGEIGETTTFNFMSPPAEPTLNLLAGTGGHNLVFVPAASSELVMQATNINTLELKISPITIDDLSILLHPENQDYRQLFYPDDIEVLTHEFDLTRNINQVINIPLTYRGQSLKSGIYYLEMSSPDIQDPWWQEQKFYLVVSENNLVMKLSPEQSVIWASRLSDLSPLSDVPIAVYDCEGNQITNGITDLQGLFTSQFDRMTDPFKSIYAVAGEPGQSDFAFTISSWSQGYALYEEGIQVNTLPELVDAYIYTDRSIYRPGDVVYFKGMVFSLDNGLPFPSKVKGVLVNVYSTGGMSGNPTKLYSVVKELNQFGSITDSIQLPEDSTPGRYWIEFVTKEKVIKEVYFDVAAYRKPGIDVNVDFVSETLLVGDNILGTIQADYYFGLSAAELPLTWALYSQKADFNLPSYHVGPLDSSWSRYPWIDSPGRLVASGEGETDSNGKLTLALSDEDYQSEYLLDGSLLELILEATVMDDAGYAVSYRDSSLMHPEKFYIGVKPESIFGQVDSPISFSIQTAAWDGSAAAEIAIEAVFETIQWQLVETLNPELPYEYKPITSLIASASPVTDESGQARLSFTPSKPGTYRLKLLSGRSVTEVLVWVEGEGTAAWTNLTHNRISLNADAEAYQPGQIAHIFIPNPFSGQARAIITMERGLVMDKQVVNIEGSGHLFSIPLTEDAIPNIYVSVVLIGMNESGLIGLRQGTLNLPVTPVNKTLNISLEIEPGFAEPGDIVSASLKVSDHQDKPVQGEFSIFVVDKALLSLTESHSHSILDGFFGEQPLSVQTSISLLTYAAQLSLPGVDGGLGGGSDGMAASDLRKKFPDTAFWQADVVTGTDGKAQIEIPLPDTLTTWVVDVRGLTEDYKVGQASAEILTRKQLMVQPVTPRFFVDGDIAELSAIVHNNTNEDLAVSVTIEGEGFTLLEPINQTQDVFIQADSREKMDWQVIINSVNSVTPIFSAESNGFSDSTTSIWGDLPVLRYQFPMTASTSGLLSEEGQWLELVSLPYSVEPKSGYLSISLFPSLAGYLSDSVKSFDGFQYEDTLTVLSRLRANLYANSIFSSITNEPFKTNDLEIKINSDIYRLLNTQNFDGGWSWWYGQSENYLISDPIISANVLLALEEAKEAGFFDNENVILMVQDFVVDQMNNGEEYQSGFNYDQLAFQVYVLQKGDQSLDDLIDDLFIHRSQLSPWAAGLLALTLSDHDHTMMRANTMIADLEGSAVRSAAGVHWQTEKKKPTLPNSINFNTAVVIYTLAKLDPASQSLLPSVRYLLEQRTTDDLWQSPLDSAWVIASLSETLKGTGDYQSDFEYKATLNNVLVTEGISTGVAATNEVTRMINISELHAELPNALVIERGPGAGSLYYLAHLQSFVSAKEASSIDQGINIQRDYYLLGEDCDGIEDCEPIKGIRLNAQESFKTITAAITVIIPDDLVNIMLVDHIPAGTEIINPNLHSSQMVKFGFSVINEQSLLGHVMARQYFGTPQIYDNQIRWAAEFIPAGTYILTYDLLPVQRGDYQVLPARAWQFYNPEVQGTSAGTHFIIE